MKHLKVYVHLLDKRVYYCSTITAVLHPKSDISVININRADYSISIVSSMLFYAYNRNPNYFNCFMKTVCLVYSNYEGGGIIGKGGYVSLPPKKTSKP